MQPTGGKYPGGAEESPVRIRAGAAVDVHAHYVPRDIVRVDKRFSIRSDRVWKEALYLDDDYLGPMPDRLTDLSLMVEEMTATGITRRICCGASWMTFYGADPGLGREVTRASNEEIAAAVRKYPDRLLGLAALPLQDVDAAVEEMDYAVRQLGLVGVAIGTSVSGVYYDAPEFAPLFAHAQKLDVPLFFHPDDVAGASRLDDYYLTRLIGNPHEATLSLARLILGGVLEQFPDVRLCFPMGGGSIPLLIGRITHGWSVRPEAKERAPRSPDEYLRRCYFDTIVHSQDAFDYLASVVPSSQLVLGSDYPWDMGSDDPRSLIESSAALTRDEMDGVLYRNVEHLLRTTDATNKLISGEPAGRRQAL